MISEVQSKARKGIQVQIKVSIPIMYVVAQQNFFLWFKGKTKQNKFEKFEPENILIVVIYKNTFCCTHFTQISLQCQ